MTQFKNIYLLVSAAFAIIACKPTVIVGNWQRVWPDSHKHNHEGEGDLIIRPNSTYFIKGNSRQSKIDTISGWHTGEDKNLYWDITKGKVLTLYYDSSFTLKNMYLSFEITHLSNKKLQINVGGLRLNTITYLRK